MVTGRKDAAYVGYCSGIQLSPVNGMKVLGSEKRGEEGNRSI